MFLKNKIRLCFVGNPNVGKSTLINRILGINKLKTDSKPGTTKKISETLPPPQSRPGKVTTSYQMR